MVNLVKYKEYWQRLPERITGIGNVTFVAKSDDFGKIVQAMSPTALPMLWVLIPQSRGSGKTVDGFKERTIGVVFLMSKYDPQRKNEYDELSYIQPIVEDIKRTMMDDIARSCHILGSIDPSTVQTLPETEVYKTLAGWSVSFVLD